MKLENSPGSTISPDARGQALARSAREWDIGPIVDRLRESREVTHSVRFHGRVRELPSRAELVAVVGKLYAALFPTHFGRHDLTDESIDFFVGATLNDALLSLSEQIRRGLQFAPGRDAEADSQLLDEAVSGLARKKPQLSARQVLSNAQGGFLIWGVLLFAMLFGVAPLAFLRGAIAVLWALLTRRLDTYEGYLVDAPAALAILEAAHPDAAAWWRANTPHLFRPRRRFIFQKGVGTVITRVDHGS